MRLPALAMIVSMCARAAFAGPHCVKLSAAEWDARAAQWSGRAAVAFASWCSSCRGKILDAQKDPQKYVLISVFEEPEASEKVIRKLGLKSECVYGDELPGHLGIKALPWEKGI